MQLGARRDPQLREQAVEMGTDCAMREIEALANLAVGEALSGQLGNLHLLGREMVARIRGPGAPRLARGAQLQPRALSPRERADRIEDFDCGAQRRAGVSQAPVAAQPATIPQLQPRAEE